MERVRGRHFTKVWSTYSNQKISALVTKHIGITAFFFHAGFVQGAEALPVIVGVPMTGYINQQAPRAGFYFSTAATLAGALMLFFVGFSKREPEAPPPAPAPAISEACLCMTPPRCGPTWCACSAGGATAYCVWPTTCTTRLPKSLSYAAPLNRTCCAAANYPECCRRSALLRPSRSVPEGLAKCPSTWNRAGSCRSACNRREQHLIEQITTSV